MLFRIPQRDLAVVVGRFNHLQNGHVSLFEQGLSQCNRLLIMVGSAQEQGTLRNPFSLETRINVIKKNYPYLGEDVLMIRGLKDLSNELDVTTDWGDYVKEEVEKITDGKFASCMVYGNDAFRSEWFTPEALKDTIEIIVPRSAIKISGTMIRGYLTLDTPKARNSWRQNVPELIHPMYQSLRDELMSVPIYRQIYDEVRQFKDMDLDTFNQVYKKYEEQDRQIKLAAIAAGTSGQSNT